MLILIVENRYTTIKGADRMIVRLLQDVTSYLISGSWFSPAYQDKRWDGREKLLKFSEVRGYYFPTGLLKDVTNKLKELKIKFKINTKKRKTPSQKELIEYSWNKKIKLRPYQKKACKHFLKNGLFKGSGILKMPTRSGKTKTLARILYKLSVKSLVIVTSKILLYQTQKSLEESLLCDVGLIGDGNWIEKNITVATAQTLARLLEKAKPKPTKGRKKKSDKKSREKWNKFCKSYDCIAFDEVHHLTASTWHREIMEFDACYKIGLSATAFPDEQSQWEKGVIWLKACCGNIRFDVGTTELIESGYLVAPVVKLHKVKEPNLLKSRWSQTLRNLAIYENEYRNNLISKITMRYVKKGKLVLVVTNRLNQVKILTRIFDKMKISHHTITGNDKSASRNEKVSDFVGGHVKALIGTVLSEGVDIPEIDVVINAEGGADMKSTIQRLRNLTISEGKNKAYVVDFIDLTNRYFANHSRKRLEVYRKEEAFKVVVMKN